jgi:hypothetical protein
VEYPPLRSLHLTTSLSQVKLTTDELKYSLAPGQAGSLKTRTDGTIIDGHHRIEVLRRRGINVDQLPREILLKE